MWIYVYRCHYCGIIILHFLVLEIVAAGYFFTGKKHARLEIYTFHKFQYIWFDVKIHTILTKSSLNGKAGISIILYRFMKAPNKPITIITN